MKLGFGLPHGGNTVSPQTIVQIAQEAERLGFDSVWTYEHLLRPTRPIPGVLGGEPMVQSHLYGSCYDPLETLAYVAAKTERVKLGTGVVNALFHPPVVLGKRFATIDQLSGGRAIAGFGQGWMPDEFVTTGVPMKRRGAGFEEYIHALRAVWGSNPVKFDGRFYTIPEAEIGPKPFNPTGIPIILGAFVPAALQRAALIADGIMPGNMPWEVFEQIVYGFRGIAQQAGRDASKLQIIIRVVDIPGQQLPLTGSFESITEDLFRVQKLGVDQVIFDPGQLDTPIDEQLRFMEQLGTLIPQLG
ncbi:LLM class flavin-dependent oxidoreductase [Tengunoibacter tsumagoiensis]|uniref:LLM class F420-dependent oxidoreductase n=1 Tax=Tengunoibacter tsumagoiensis TaxID=2014871 RepID=A0A402A6M7_9CHLR|nr:LLM class flavin-dependent oxidoreductase [Tengunoibacter tsumagoiensis]GCE14790.1 LLM class F420-dependent oxidoreductase [Tengunoibacter tsumagoiensis]